MRRWDGIAVIRTGWRAKRFPLLARILQVADIYDALTTARPYKPAFSHQHAIEIMIEEARRGWRDPELVPLFAEVSQHNVPQHGDTAATHWPGNTSMKQSLDNMRRELSK